jgi:CRP/FNR family cyclic AMP-dependent transcriptional regulator
MDHTLLQQIPLFAGLSEGEVRTIARHAVVKRVPRTTVLMHQGDTPNALYVVLGGRVRVLVTGADGRELVLDTLGPGEYFGELALIDGEPRSATVVAADDTELGVISKTDFTAVLGSSPETAISLLRGLSQRVRELNEHLTDFALLDVHGRVCRVLGRLVHRRDGHLSTDPVTQQEIASMVGASREMVSRVMQALKAAGAIRIEGKIITVLDEAVIGS